jgi:hypothetical protein
VSYIDAAKTILEDFESSIQFVQARHRGMLHDLAIRERIGENLKKKKKKTTTKI